MQKCSFNEGWEFTNIDLPADAISSRCMTVFSPVSLPHDYTVENPFDKSNPSGHQGGYVRTGTLWYRKFWTLQEIPAHLFLLFDGVYSNAEIFINGQKVYEREYGYISFCVEATEYLRPGINLVAVRVDGSREPSTRWFNGQGITRNVWVLEAEPIYIAHDSVFVAPKEIADTGAVLQVEAGIVNPFAEEQSVQVDVEILDQQGKAVARQSCTVLLKTGQTTVYKTISLPYPHRWNLEDPYLYTAEIKSRSSGRGGQDAVRVRFGVRTTEFRPREGFFLNGKHTLFKGVCMHHDGGCVGAAVPKALWRKRILQLKKMGCNAIRTAHNPFNPEFYDLCDELGIMVMDEIFDGWERPKVEYGYGTIWEKCHVRDLTDFILRDRNHPCIMLWSIGNEVLDMRTQTTQELMGIIRALDPTRKITAGVQGTGRVSEDNRAVLDVAGYNDGGGACFLYEQDHEKRPEQLFIATEAPHSFQTRGFYRTQTWWRDKNQPRQEIENLTEQEIFFDQSIHYNSSYDNSGVRTCARDSWSFVEQYPYLCGEFRWTGYDYLGEAFPYTWPSKTHSFGVLDTANFPKDHYYLYQSLWGDAPVLHILPHWTHPTMEKGTSIPVWVYTNLEAVELFLNDVSLGRQERQNRKNLQWCVPYQPGRLVAKGYVHNELVLVEEVKTAKTAEEICLEPEILSEENEPSIVQLTVRVQDGTGTFVPVSNAVTGIILPRTIQLLGSDNGAIDDMTPLKSSIRKAFNGLCMYLLRVDAQHGDAEGAVGAILGDSYFDEETVVTLKVCPFALATTPVKSYDIFYTTDGTVPTSSSRRYTGSFAITETTVVKMRVELDREPVLFLSEVFVKGRPEPVVDLAHLNYEVELERPAGPFSDKIVGSWRYDACEYIFYADGALERKIGSICEKMGYWWYDFPSDFLETPDYAGTGELWLLSGERVSIHLSDQTARELVVDNREGGMGNIAVNIPELILTHE